MNLDLTLELVKTSNLSFEDEESIKQSLTQELTQMIRESYNTNELDLSFAETRIRRFITNGKIVKINKNENYRHPFREVLIGITDNSVEAAEEQATWTDRILTVSDEERIVLSSFNITFIQNTVG